MLKVLAKLNTAVLARRDRGATMVEYGLMVASMAYSAIVAPRSRLVRRRPPKVLSLS